MCWDKLIILSDILIASFIRRSASCGCVHVCVSVEKVLGSIGCEAVGTSLVLSCLLLRVATEREDDSVMAKRLGLYRFDMKDKNKVCHA